MSFACSSSVNLGVLVAANVIVLVVVLGRHGCKICENHKLARATLVIGVVAEAALVDLVAVEPVFRAE